MRFPERYFAELSFLLILLDHATFEKSDKYETFLKEFGNALN